MAYYIRVLSTSSDPVPLQQIRAALARERLNAILTPEEGFDSEWKQVTLSHAGGEAIAIIERNLVEAGSLAEGELDEFNEEISISKPESAARWLGEFFPKVRCIYAFQLLKGKDVGDGWDILGEAKNAIWRQAPAIIQADGEGFSDEDGYHILWQFSESVKGTWWMGVRKGEKWIHFQMDLGNLQHRKAFMAGEMPPGAKLA